MLSKTLSVLLLLLLPAVAASAAEVPFGQGLLFRVETPGVPASHVFATMHSNDDRVLAMPLAAIEAFDRADRLLLELDNTDRGLPPELVRRYLVLGDGRDLPQLIGREAFAEAARIGADYQFFPADLARLNPIALILVLARPAQEVLRQRQGWAILDQALENEARALGKPVHALETAEEQLRYLTALSEAQQVKLLVHVLDEFEAEMSQFQDLLRYYLLHDLAGLFRTMEAEGRELDRLLQADYYERLVNERNRVMAERMQRHLVRGSAFVAIGAGHLPGERGVLSLLQQRGFTVTPVD
jgi:hypothetical protein